MVAIYPPMVVSLVAAIRTNRHDDLICQFQMWCSERATIRAGWYKRVLLSLFSCGEAFVRGDGVILSQLPRMAFFAQNSVVGAHTLALEKCPQVLGPLLRLGGNGRAQVSEDTEEDYGDVLTVMYAPDCLTIDQARIGRAGNPVIGSGTG
jgi:hypothetical protein